MDGDYRKELAVETSESRELRNYSSQKERGSRSRAAQGAEKPRRNL